MATVTIRNRSRKVSPEAQQRAQRLAAMEAAMAADVEADRVRRAQLKGNGCDSNPEPAKFEVTVEKFSGGGKRHRVDGIDIIVSKFRREGEFRSAPDARPMTKRDIANVEFMDSEQIDAMTTELAEASPTIFAKIRQKLADDWKGLLNENEIWTLTTMAMRKYNRTGELPK